MQHADNNFVMQVLLSNAMSWSSPYIPIISVHFLFSSFATVVLFTHPCGCVCENMALWQSCAWYKMGMGKVSHVLQIVKQIQKTADYTYSVYLTELHFVHLDMLIYYVL